MTTIKKLEDDLKKNGRRPQKKMEDNLKKNGKRPQKIKWKTNQSTKINLIGCDTIVNSPSLGLNQKSNKYVSILDFFL